MELLHRRCCGLDVHKETERDALAPLVRMVRRGKRRRHRELVAPCRIANARQLQPLVPRHRESCARAAIGEVVWRFRLWPGNLRFPETGDLFRGGICRLFRKSPRSGDCVVGPGDVAHPRHIKGLLKGAGKKNDWKA